ncbi:His/Gly/Thr/Pro-type tRNA ligase C-terminal domain-containing protein [Vibrio pectenicida]
MKLFVMCLAVSDSNCHVAKYVADRLIDTDMPILTDFSKSSVGRKMKRFHKKKIPFVITLA